MNPFSDGDISRKPLFFCCACMCMLLVVLFVPQSSSHIPRAISYSIIGMKPIVETNERLGCAPAYSPRDANTWTQKHPQHSHIHHRRKRTFSRNNRRPIPCKSRQKHRRIHQTHRSRLRIRYRRIQRRRQNLPKAQIVDLN